MKYADYVRYSDSRQKETSLEDQRRIIHEWAAQNGHEIVAEFEDAALTGTTASSRPGLQELLEEVASPDRRFDGVAIHQLSRLSRNMGDTWHILFRTFKFHKVQLVAVADGIDTQNPAVKMVVAIKSLQNEMFIDDQRKNVKRGMDGQFMRGFSTGSWPFGYNSKPNYIEGAENDHRAVLGYTLRPDPAEADIVREIFRRYKEGEGYRTIARAMNASTKYKFTVTRLYGILQNPIYIGQRLFNKHEHAKHPETGKTTFLLRDQKEWLTKFDPSLAIIDETTWEAVQKLKNEHAGLFKDRKSAAKHLLTGLLFCESCGGRLAIVRHSYYGCPNAYLNSNCTNTVLIQRESLEQVIIGAIAQYLPSHLEELVESVRHRIEARSQETHATHQSTQDLEAQAERILAFIQDGTLQGRAKEKAQQTFQGLHNQIEELEKQNNKTGTFPVTVSYDRQVLKEFIANLPTALASDQVAGAELLAHIVSRVRIRGGHARLRTCPVCGVTLKKFGPPHARLHNMEFSEFIRKYPWIGCTHEVVMTLTFNPNGLFKKEKIVGLKILGAPTIQTDDLPPVVISV